MSALEYCNNESKEWGGLLNNILKHIEQANNQTLDKNGQVQNDNQIKMEIENKKGDSFPKKIY